MWRLGLRLELRGQWLKNTKKKKKEIIPEGEQHVRRKAQGKGECGILEEATNQFWLKVEFGQLPER